MTHNEIQANLHIFDFNCTIEEITQAIGIQPDAAYLKGDRRPIKENGQLTSSVPVSQNTWTLNSKLTYDKSIEEHIEAILEQISRTSQFKSVSSRFYVELSVGAYFFEANPGIHLNKQILKQLSELNISLDLDLYCLGDDEETA